MSAIRLLTFTTLLIALTAIPHSIPRTTLALAAAQTCKTVSTHGKKRKVCKPAPSYAGQAEALTAAYAKATTGDGRLKALEAIMNALHITVYGPGGATVVHGAGTQQDPFMVEILLQIMAQKTQVGETTNLTDLAHDLSLLGIKDSSGQPLAADVLARAVETGIHAAVANPSRSTSLAPLLIRDLGLHDSPSVDLATTVPASQVQLDSIQRYLLSADILIPWALSNGPAAHAMIAGSASESSWLFGGGPQGPSPVQQAVQSASALPPPMALSDVLLYYKAQALKNYVLDIHRVMDKPLLETHYGPQHPDDGGLGGKQLSFDLHADVPPGSGSFLNVSSCLSQMTLLGLSNVCDALDLNGMKVDWNNLDSIKPYGVLHMIDPSSEVSNRESNIQFYPNTEPVPDLGPLKVAAGVITAVPHVAARLDITDPKLAAMVDAQYADQQFPWKVSYHATPNFTFTLPSFRVFSRPGDKGDCAPEHSCDGGALTTVQASTVHLCGLATGRSTYESPEEGQTVQTYTGGSTSTIPLHNGFIEWHIDPQKLTLFGEGLYSHIYIEGRIYGSPPKITVRLSGPSTINSSKVYSASPDLVTVPVQVDSSC